MNLRKDHYWITWCWAGPIGHVLASYYLSISCAPFVVFEVFAVNAVWGLGFCSPFPVCFKGYVLYTLFEVTECLLLTFESVNQYNFQQRISWLSHRWRTQRNAISNVNCRIQWIIESLNAPCALWYSEGHACLSVIKFSTLQAFLLVRLGCEGFCWLPSLDGLLPLNSLVDSFVDGHLVW